MFKFLFVMFFFFILLVFLMGFSILRTFKNMLFGSGSSGKKGGGQRRQATTNNANTSGSQRTKPDNDFSHSSSNKKIFTKEEGEYVDYEEVK